MILILTTMLAGCSALPGGKVNPLWGISLYVDPDSQSRTAATAASEGGASAHDVDVLARLAGLPAVVILEPDALGLAGQCGNTATRIQELSGAVNTLAGSKAITYIDAGHSDWISPGGTASLLAQVGLEKTAGFATNVSSYRSTVAEQSYADKISALANDAHYVIDTSRNGAQTNCGWCNSPDCAVGAAPAAPAPTMDHWTAGAKKTLSLALSATLGTDTGQQVYLSTLTVDYVVNGPDGVIAGGPAQFVDRAVVVPGYLVKVPYSYSQNLVVSTLDPAATSVDVTLAYEILVQAAPASSDYAKQTATDTLKIAIAH